MTHRNWLATVVQQSFWRPARAAAWLGYDHGSKTLLPLISRSVPRYAGGTSRLCCWRPGNLPPRPQARGHHRAEDIRRATRGCPYNTFSAGDNGRRALLARSVPETVNADQVSSHGAIVPDSQRCITQRTAGGDFQRVLVLLAFGPSRKRAQ